MVGATPVDLGDHPHRGPRAARQGGSGGAPRPEHGDLGVAHLEVGAGLLDVPQLELAVLALRLEELPAERGLLALRLGVLLDEVGGDARERRLRHLGVAMVVGQLEDLAADTEVEALAQLGQGFGLVEARVEVQVLVQLLEPHAGVDRLLEARAERAGRVGGGGTKGAGAERAAVDQHRLGAVKPGKELDQRQRPDDADGEDGEGGAPARAGSAQQHDQHLQLIRLDRRGLKLDRFGLHRETLPRGWDPTLSDVAAEVHDLNAASRPAASLRRLAGRAP